MTEDLTEILKSTERILDEKLQGLSIWKHNFQTIFCSLLYYAEKIDFDANDDTTVDYLSRISVLWKTISQLSVKAEISSTVEALMSSNNDEQFLADLNFLYQYGHFAMLMPQIHRDVFAIEKKEECFILSYKTPESTAAELKDKVLSCLAQENTFSLRFESQLKLYLYKKILSGNFDIDAKDGFWINRIYEHHLTYSHRNEVLPDEIAKEHLGFTNADFDRFWAGMKAMGDFMHLLGRTFKGEAVQHLETQEFFISEHIEWSVCTHDLMSFFGNVKKITGLGDKEFNAILSYYCLIYERPENQEITSRAFCKDDGFFPPFTLTKHHVIYSPLLIRYFNPFNNILYSMSKKQQAVFDNKISSCLEPTLVAKAINLFNGIRGLKALANINYHEGEIDFMVLSEQERTCLCFQVKATIAPSSTRGLFRVETRSLEGIEQIERFEHLTEEEKTKIINTAFGVNLPMIDTIGILMVSASAGSSASWEKPIPICNLSLLSGLLGKKTKEGNFDISNFSNELTAYLEELIGISKWQVTDEKITFEELQLQFPDISFDDHSLIARNLSNMAALKTS